MTADQTPKWEPSPDPTVDFIMHFPEETRQVFRVVTCEQIYNHVISLETLATCRHYREDFSPIESVWKWVNDGQSGWVKVLFTELPES